MLGELNDLIHASAYNRTWYKVNAHKVLLLQLLTLLAREEKSSERLSNQSMVMRPPQVLSQLKDLFLFGPLISQDHACSPSRPLSFLLRVAYLPQVAPFRALALCIHLLVFALCGEVIVFLKMGRFVKAGAPLSCIPYRIKHIAEACGKFLKIFVCVQYGTVENNEFSIQYHHHNDIIA